MDREQRTTLFREMANTLTRVDLPVYQQFEKDPTIPILGEGQQTARLAIFGRDPGREEVRHGLPFIGAGGQLVRAALFEALFERPMNGMEDAKIAGEHVFWLNTLPYKPLGNKAWPMADKKRFFPLVADVLLTEWQGETVITLGREAFFWFGIGRNRDVRQALKDFWSRDDRFDIGMPFTFQSTDGRTRALMILPLPHPSPLNAVWFKHFPALLRARLRSLDFSLSTWRM